MLVEELILDKNNTINKPKLLLLGGSTDQLFAIRTAQKMGLHTIVVDMNPESPGFKEADDYGVVSTRDTDALIKFVDNYQSNNGKIDGVLVMGGDIPQIVCTVAKHIESPHIPMKAAMTSTHKYAMKECFKEHNIPIPWFLKLDSPEHLKAIISQRGLPLIIKPVDRSGARGVFYIDKNSDIEYLFHLSKELSFSGEVMVEEYLAGIQISTETIMFQGLGYTPGFADRNYEMLNVFAPNIIENGGWMPSILSLDDKKAVENLAEKAALALGVTTGVVKGDIVITPEGPKIIEMATRLSGGDFSESLIPLGCGVNIVEEAIKIAIGKEPNLDNLKPKFHKGVVNRYFFPEHGRLIRIEGAEKVKNIPWLKKLEFWYKPGDILPKIKSHADRFGVFIVTGNTRAEAEHRAGIVYDAVNIITETV